MTGMQKIQCFPLSQPLPTQIQNASMSKERDPACLRSFERACLADKSGLKMEMRCFSFQRQCRLHGQKSFRRQSLRVLPIFSMRANLRRRINRTIRILDEREEKDGRRYEECKLYQSVQCCNAWPCKAKVLM